MKRLLLILTIASVTLCQTVHAQYYSVNYVDESRLLDFLQNDAVYHTFLLADIGNYGFDQEFQTVYAGLEEDRITQMCIRDSLIIYYGLSTFYHVYE